MSGERFFSPGISRLIVDGFIKRAEEQTRADKKAAVPGNQQLTKRETEILKYIAEGYTNRQIADALFLSFRTVNTHRANLMQKLDIHETAGLVRYAITLGLVEPVPDPPPSFFSGPIPALFPPRWTYSICCRRKTTPYARLRQRDSMRMMGVLFGCGPGALLMRDRVLLQ